MPKKLEDMTFDELVNHASQVTLENLLKGEPLRRSVFTAVELGVRWKHLQNQGKGNKWT